MSWWTKYTEVEVELAIANALAGGGPGTPSAPVGSLQFNDAGALGGDADLTWTPGDANGLSVLTNLRVGADAVFSQDSDAHAWEVLTIGKVVTDPAADAVYGANIDVTFDPSGPLTDFPFLRAIRASATIADGQSMANVSAETAALFVTNNAATSFIRGIRNEVTNFGSLSLYASAVSHSFGNSGTVPNVYGDYVTIFNFDGGAVSEAAFSFYAVELAGVAPNSYSFWSDEQGVFRIRADNTFDSVYQAIAALYNPKFTKYTPGATDHERIILGQWNNNVAEIGTEKGGGGTLRKLRLIGAGLLLDATILPTSNPGAGQLWNDGNTVKVGT